VAAGGLYSYGTYPDIEGLIQEQAAERDRKRRETVLNRIQPLMHERAMFAPFWVIVTIHGHGPRVAESGLGLIDSYPFSAHYEEVRLNPR
jgi:peptide/nickel transport system substrate-binding protein